MALLQEYNDKPDGHTWMSKTAPAMCSPTKHVKGIVDCAHNSTFDERVRC
jgi:hypothetical protein